MDFATSLPDKSVYNLEKLKKAGSVYGPVVSTINNALGCLFTG